VQAKLNVFTRARNGIKKGLRPIEINRTAIKPDVVGNSPLFLQCDKEGVVIYGLRSLDAKR